MLTLGTSILKEVPLALREAAKRSIRRLIASCTGNKLACLRSHSLCHRLQLSMGCPLNSDRDLRSKEDQSALAEVVRTSIQLLVASCSNLASRRNVSYRPHYIHGMKLNVPQATAAPSHTSTSGTARLNPASAPFTPPAAASQRQLQDILPPAQPIFVRPAKKPVTVAPPLPHAPNASKIPQVEGQQTATKLGPSVTGVDASQSQSTSRHEPSDTNNKVSDGPGVKGTPAPVSSVIEPRPQQAQNATASLRAWFDQLVKKEQATPSAKQISADSDELITFSDPNSPERVAGATQGDVANEQTKPDTLHQAPIPSGRDIFSQMPPAVRAAIQRVQRKASSTMGVKTHLPQEKPMTSPSLTSAQKEDKAMADAFGKLQAHWAKARWPKSPKGKENVRLAHVPAMPGSGEAAEVPANDDPTPKAFQEIREPAPLVPYASSEDSFDTRDSSNVSSSDHNSHGIGGSHVLGQYLAPDVKAMVLRGRKTNIQSPTDPLTAAQLKHMEVDRMGNKWQKIDRIGAGGRQKFGWVISNFYDPTTSDPHSKA